MKAIFFVLSIVASCFVVHSQRCPDITWVCPRRRGKHTQNVANERVKRDSAPPQQKLSDYLEELFDESVLCLLDESECDRRRILRRWERTRTKVMMEKKARKEANGAAKKRELDCPFGVWNCIKNEIAQVKNIQSRQPCDAGNAKCLQKKDDQSVDDLIDEIFATS